MIRALSWCEMILQVTTCLGRRVCHHAGAHNSNLANAHSEMLNKTSSKVCRETREYYSSAWGVTGGRWIALWQERRHPLAPPCPALGVVFSWGDGCHSADSACRKGMVLRARVCLSCEMLSSGFLGVPTCINMFLIRCQSLVWLGVCSRGL